MSLSSPVLNLPANAASPVTGTRISADAKQVFTLSAGKITNTTLNATRGADLVQIRSVPSAYQDAVTALGAALDAAGEAREHIWSTVGELLSRL